MIKLFQSITNGPKKQFFGPFDLWKTLKRKTLNTSGFKQNKATITLVLDLENYKVLISSFRDMSRNVSNLANFSTSRPVNQESCVSSTGSFHYIVVHSCLYIHTRHYKDLAWSHNQAISKYFICPISGRLTPFLTREPDFFQTCSFRWK